MHTNLLTGEAFLLSNNFNGTYLALPNTKQTDRTKLKEVIKKTVQAVKT